MESLISRASELHSASGVARSVLNLTHREDFVIKELVSCIEMDPALTARVLATVNSARFGLNRQVSNVQQAVALLGRQSLRTMALTFSVVDAFTQGVSAKVYTDYWRRSLTTSLVASLLGQMDPDIEANDALVFVCKREGHWKAHIAQSADGYPFGYCNCACHGQMPAMGSASRSRTLPSRRALPRA